MLQRSAKTNRHRSWAGLMMLRWCQHRTTLPAEAASKTYGGRWIGSSPAGKSVVSCVAAFRATAHISRRVSSTGPIAARRSRPEPSRKRLPALSSIHWLAVAVRVPPTRELIRSTITGSYWLRISECARTPDLTEPQYRTRPGLGLVQENNLTSSA